MLKEISCALILGFIRMIIITNKAKLGDPTSYSGIPSLFNRSFDQLLLVLFTRMSSTNEENVKEQEQEIAVDDIESQVDAQNSKQEQNDSEKIDENPIQQEEIINTKYGGIVPKKRPLISKDHERAFFDSADWALGKQGAQKPKGPLEALRPKLQPTPHQQVRSRRSAYAPSDDEEPEDGNSNNTTSEDQSCASDGGSNSNNNPAAPEDQSFLRSDGTSF